MNCPKCSGENPDTQRFCGECGTPLPASSPADDAAASLTETQIIPWVELKTGVMFAGRYQIIEELGEGGMGRVYRVLDTKVDEEIALKLVKYDAACDRKSLERLRAELKRGRKVAHQNVARMFDLNEADGVPYITMQYVRGENLRRLIRKVGRLDASQAVPIATQVCLGLAEAHRQDIIHRDLKPQNIMIDEDGKAHIMDFGLAQLASSVGRTGRGAVEGTPAYIAPELVAGRPPDRRVDLYSLGIVLYEMVTGRPPFTADSAQALAVKHMTDLPRDPRETNPDVPVGLVRIIMRCLEKKPERRYQSAEEVLTDLGYVEQELSTGKILVPPIKEELEDKEEREKPKPGRRLLRAAAALAVLAAVGYGAYHIVPIAPLRPSIAVLLDSSAEIDESLPGLSRELLKNTVQKLASIPRLRVVPWETVSGLRGAGLSDKKAGADLGAKYLLRLNLRAVGDHYWLTANLIHAARGNIVQAYNMDRPKEEYFLLEDDLPWRIARALKVHFVEERLRKIKQREPKNLEAYNHFLDGNAILSRDFEAAVAHFEKAIEIDPRYAHAYWGLGNAYEARYNRPPPEGGRSEDLERMFQAYHMAYDINPNSPEANLGLGWAYFYERDNAKAAERFRQALKLDPGSFMVNKDAGAFLRSLGLYDRAVKYLSRAVRLNPIEPEPLTQIAQCRAFMGRYESARKLMEKAVVIAPDSRSYLSRYASQLALTGRLEEAQKALEAFERRDPHGQKPRLAAAFIAAARGEREAALSLIGEPHPLTFEEAWIFLLLGMKDEAIENIEAGIEKGFTERGMYLYSYPCLSKNPRFKTLRDEPRFREILSKQKDFYLKELKKLEKL